MLKSTLDDDVHLRGMEGAAPDFALTQSVAVQLEAFESVDQLRPRQAGVHQRAQHHVPADSRETIKMQMPSHYILRSMAAHLTQGVGLRQIHADGSLTACSGYAIPCAMQLSRCAGLSTIPFSTFL